MERQLRIGDKELLIIHTNPKLVVDGREGVVTIKDEIIKDIFNRPGRDLQIHGTIYIEDDFGYPRNVVFIPDSGEKIWLQCPEGHQKRGKPVYAYLHQMLKRDTGLGMSNTEINISLL